MHELHIRWDWCFSSRGLVHDPLAHPHVALLGHDGRLAEVLLELLDGLLTILELRPASSRSHTTSCQRQLVAADLSPRQHHLYDAHLCSCATTTISPALVMRCFCCCISRCRVSHGIQSAVDTLNRSSTRVFSCRRTRMARVLQLLVGESKTSSTPRQSLRIPY